jgi:threonine synthase
MYVHIYIQELAFSVMSLFIDKDEIPSNDLRILIDKSYTSFRTREVTPVKEVGGMNFTYIQR